MAERAPVTALGPADSGTTRSPSSRRYRRFSVAAKRT